MKDLLSFKTYKSLREAREKQLRSPERLPAVIVFKRIATRLFPERQEVSTYYSDQIKKTYIFPSHY